MELNSKTELLNIDYYSLPCYPQNYVMQLKISMSIILWICMRQCRRRFVLANSLLWAADSLCLRQFEVEILASNLTVWYTGDEFPTKVWNYLFDIIAERASVFCIISAYRRQHIIQKLETPKLRFEPTKNIYLWIYPQRSSWKKCTIKIKHYIYIFIFIYTL